MIQCYCLASRSTSSQQSRQSPRIFAVARRIGWQLGRGAPPQPLAPPPPPTPPPVENKRPLDLCCCLSYARAECGGGGGGAGGRGWRWRVGKGPMLNCWGLNVDRDVEIFGNAVWLFFCWHFSCLVPEMESFFYHNHSNGPHCDALIRAAEMLSKQDKWGLDSTKPLL